MRTSSDLPPPIPADPSPFAHMKFARGVFVACLLALCVWVLQDFLPALVWALVIAIATWPARERLVRAGLHPAGAAALLTVAFGLVLVLPVVLFGAELAREAAALADIFEHARRGELQPPDWLGQLPVVGQYAADWWTIHLATPANAPQLPTGQAPTAVEVGRDVGRFVIRRIVIFGFTLLTLFFLYKDGHRLTGDLERIGVRIFGSSARTYGAFSIKALQGTVNGLILVGFAEGALMGVGYALSGVPHPIGFALVTGVLGIIPFGAPAAVTVAAVTLIVEGHLSAGLALLILGWIAIFIIDHTARPALIGNAIRLPFFWALLGVFGGLEAFGLVGLFLGPAILAVALAIWREAIAHPALPETR
jgi:predicted PurR-regulated permease PerM